MVLSDYDCIILFIYCPTCGQRQGFLSLSYYLFPHEWSIEYHTLTILPTSPTNPSSIQGHAPPVHVVSLSVAVYAINGNLNPALDSHLRSISCLKWKFVLFSWYLLELLCSLFSLYSLHTRAVGREIQQHCIPFILYYFGLGCCHASLHIQVRSSILSYSYRLGSN